MPSLASPDTRAAEDNDDGDDDDGFGPAPTDTQAPLIAAYVEALLAEFAPATI